MTADDPNARPTRSFAADPASGDPPPDHTRTFSADPAATASFSMSAPPPLAGPVPGWPASLTRYQPLHALGGGGMGLVYLCHDRQLDRQVAVKLSGGGRAAQDRIDFLLREARSAARLHHPNICPVFDADVSDGVPYLTMAYIDGPTLADEVKRCGPCPPDAAAKLVRLVAEAMQYAHDQGVVHRDLKPSNILLTPEREPIVTDFGLALRTDLDATTNTISGTPHYMAPEQAAGDAASIGPRSDVFALGVILFEVLVGRPPFDGSAAEVLAKVVREPVPPVRTCRPDVPKTLERIVAKATARNPKDRFPHMTAFADALTGFLRQPPAKPGLAAGLGKAFLIVAASAAAVFLLIALACGIGVLLPAMQKVRNAAERTRDSGRLDTTVPVSDWESKRKADAAHREGMKLLEQGKDSEAVARFDEAIRLDPPAKLSRTLRAVTLEKLGLYDDAIEDLDVLVKLEPQNVEHYSYRGSLRMKSKSSMHNSNAENDLLSAIRLKPDSAPLHAQRAAIRLRLGNFDGAKSDCERAVGLAPKDAEARYLRGVAKRKLGDEPGAVADIAAANKLDEQVERKLRAKGHIE